MCHGLCAIWARVLGSERGQVVVHTLIDHGSFGGHIAVHCSKVASFANPSTASYISFTRAVPLLVFVGRGMVRSTSLHSWLVNQTIMLREAGPSARVAPM